MTTLPADFWQLPAIAVVALIMIGWLFYTQHQRDDRIAAEREQYVGFITSLVDDAKGERARFMTMLDEQITNWRTTQNHSIEAYQELQKLMEQQCETTQEGFEALIKMHEQHEKSAMLRMNAVLAAVGRAEHDRGPVTVSSDARASG